MTALVLLKKPSNWQYFEKLRKPINAGALLANESTMRQLHIFCTRWNGLYMTNG